MNEYIIVNKTKIEDKIKELEDKLSVETIGYLLSAYKQEIYIYKQILSQSIPLKELIPQG